MLNGSREGTGSGSGRGARQQYCRRSGNRRLGLQELRDHLFTPFAGRQVIRRSRDRITAPSSAREPGRRDEDVNSASSACSRGTPNLSELSSAEHGTSHTTHRRAPSTGSRPLFWVVAYGVVRVAAGRKARGRSGLHRAGCSREAGRPDGKCNRKYTAPLGVRVKRCGKSAPAAG